MRQLAIVALKDSVSEQVNTDMRVLAELVPFSSNHCRARHVQSMHFFRSRSLNASRVVF